MSSGIPMGPPPPPMLRRISNVFNLPLSGLSVSMSPFKEDLLAVTTGENFGMAGKGMLWVLQLTPDGKMQPVFDMTDVQAIFDLAWSEKEPDLVN